MVGGTTGGRSAPLTARPVPTPSSWSQPGGTVVEVAPNGRELADLTELEQLNPFSMPVPGGTGTAVHVAPKSVV